MFNGVCLTLFYILVLSRPVRVRTCTRALDVVFLLDSGPDISNEVWNLMLTLSRDVTRYLHPSTYGSHVAQVQFAGNTSVVHGLSTEFVIRYRSESFQRGRNISVAIDTTRRLVLNNTDGDRPEVPDVIVLITHGLSDDKDDAIAAATRVKSEGIRIITVGVTNTELDELREELREIATNPGDVDNLILINRNYYLSVLYTLVHIVCRNRVKDPNESIRLVDGTSNTGRLEVYIQEEWATVCSNIWTDLNTRIACRQLGFLDGLSMYTMNQTFYHRRSGIANIRCTGNETNLLHCLHDPFFHIDSSCDHQRDVFLRCLCNDCNDYSPRDNVRLSDGTPVSGRLEVFSPAIDWGGVCSYGWTASNTRVACRQLGFLDGATAYQRIHRHPVTFTLFNVRCSGNENSLFDCAYSTTSQNCNGSIYIGCKCTDCLELLLQAPQQNEAMTQSRETFKWRFKHNISPFEIVFLSQKNPETLIYVTERKVVEECTRFRHRIHLTNDDNATVGFILTNITTADMGIYVLYVPRLRLRSKAILIVKDFAAVPDPVISRQINDSVTLSWDLTDLRRLHDINHAILLTTPASGRLYLDYYYRHWLRDNPGRHSVRQPPDHLHPTISIDVISANDAGIYAIELMLTSSVYQWLNSSWQFVTKLVVENENGTLSQGSIIDIDHSHPSQVNTTTTSLSPTRNPATERSHPSESEINIILYISASTIVLVVFLAILIITIVLWKLKSTYSRRAESEGPNYEQVTPDVSQQGADYRAVSQLAPPADRAATPSPTATPRQGHHSTPRGQPATGNDASGPQNDNSSQDTTSQRESNGHQQ